MAELCSAPRETTLDETAAGPIRRRRTFLSRRISELKAERERGAG